MVIREVLQKGTKILFENKIETPRLDAAVILCHAIGRDRTYLNINYNHELTKEDEIKYFKMIQKRAEGMPAAYIVGKKEFMSLEFEVNENVLIPRADTETLCEYIIEAAKGGEKIADICSGCGCIGISLGYYIKDSRVSMYDISSGAVKAAKRNAQRLGVKCDINMIDILTEDIEEKFDIVVSNPPYIESDKIDNLQREVSDYEPRLALDGGRDGLMFYRRLSKLAENILKKDGIAAFEVGCGQADAVIDIMTEVFYDIKTIRDLSGIERVVSGKRR